MIIRQAGVDESPTLAALINAAFGPAESFFLLEDRITAQAVEEYFAQGVFLVAEPYAGCVYVEPRGDRAYLGLLSVHPTYQKAGLGKRLVAAAEEWARDRGCRFVDIRVVNLRLELPPIYRKLGYIENGTEEWPDSPTRLPAHFLCMTKSLT